MATLPRPQPEEAALVRRLALAGAIVGVVFGVVTLVFRGALLPSFWLIGCGLVVGASPLVYARTARIDLVGHMILGCLLLAIGVIGPYRGQLPVSAMAFGLVVPPLALYLTGLRWAIIWTATMAVMFAGALAADLGGVFEQVGSGGISPATWTVIDIVGLTVMLVLLLLISTWYERKRHRIEHARLRAEKAMLQAQKMESVGNLAGGIAHDFNNVLTVIHTLSETASEGVEAGSQVDQDLEQIREAVKRASELTRQLLLLSRPRDEDADVTGNPRAAVESMSTMLTRGIPRTIKLEFDIDEVLPNVRASESAISQVLLNLVVNARDAMPRGGKLFVALERVEVGSAEGELLGLVPGTYVRLHVRDTGEGISAEVAERIFEPFFTTKPTGKGSGLGLATVFAIAKRAGGTVDMDSVPGEGTTFRVFFARAAAPKGRRHSTWSIKAIEPIPNAGRTVLVVEDDRRVREATTRLLINAGYDVCAVGSGAEALDELGRRGASIDVVLTDVVMPGLSGRDLADQIWQQGMTVPVLYMSGFADPRIGYIPSEQLLRKPFGRHELLHMVENIISGEGEQSS